LTGGVYWREKLNESGTASDLCEYSEEITKSI
jgi:hypothetical protein